MAQSLVRVRRVGKFFRPVTNCGARLRFQKSTRPIDGAERAAGSSYCQTSARAYSPSPMTTQPLIAAFGIGAWEIILILSVLIMLSMGAAVIVGVVWLAKRSSQKKSTTPPPLPVIPGEK